MSGEKDEGQLGPADRLGELVDRSNGAAAIDIGGEDDLEVQSLELVGNRGRVTHRVGERRRTGIGAVPDHKRHPVGRLGRR